MIKNSSASSYAELIQNHSGNQLAGFYEDVSGNGSLYVNANSSGPVLINSSGNSYLNGGNVGIGTTTRTLSP